MQIIYFESPSAFRRWLKSHGQTSQEFFGGFYKTASGVPSITYSQALDEALCHGWIDGVRRSVNRNAYSIRFTPRKPKSQWSAVNIRRAKALIEARRMTPAGRKAFAGAEQQTRKYSYEQRRHVTLGTASERHFRANRKAWEYFQAQPPWYRRTATFWVTSAKKEETRHKRLDTLIKDSERGKPIKPLQRP